MQNAQAATPPTESRAYELVSPPFKNGGDVLASSARTRASASGDAVVFSSFGTFSGAQGAGIALEYLSERQEDGWSTHGITPRQSPIPFWDTGNFGGTSPISYELFSEDLERGVIRALSPLSHAPNVVKVPNLYRRDGLREAGADDYELLSDATMPLSLPAPFEVSGALPYVSGASDDLSHVVFESMRSLTPDAPPECASLFDNCFPKLYEWVDGTVRLVGILPDGTVAQGAAAGNGASSIATHSYTVNTVSRDGSRIFFTSPVTAFPGEGEPTAASQIYMRENGAVTVRISASEKQTAGVQEGARWGGATPDGSQVFFLSREHLVDGDYPTNATDLYMYDASRPPSDPDNLTLISVDEMLADSHDVQGVIGSSDDGSYVYFVATGQLEAGEPQLDGRYGVFVWHDGEVRFVGDLEFYGDAIENIPDIYGQWPLNSRVSADGRHMTFTSHGGGHLTGYDHGSCPNPSFGFDGCRELYLYDAVSNGGEGRLVCVSCNPSGGPATSQVQVDVRANSAGAWLGHQLTRALSDDGRRVFFSTGESLVSEDQNSGKYDAYEYDTTTGEVHLLSSGKSSSNSYFMDASASGDDAFILTREQLVGWDVDENADLYDVRVGGGFPEPALPVPPCSGDACAGDAAGVPVAPAMGSVTFSGTGNVGGPAASFRTLALTPRQLRRWARTGSVGLRVRVSEAGRVSARVRARVAGRSRIVATGARSVPRAGTVVLRLRLSRAARDELSVDGRMRLAIRVGFSKAPGTQRARATLRAPREGGQR